MGDIQFIQEAKQNVPGNIQRANVEPCHRSHPNEALAADSSFVRRGGARGVAHFGEEFLGCIERERQTERIIAANVILNTSAVPSAETIASAEFARMTLARGTFVGMRSSEA